MWFALQSQGKLLTAIVQDKPVYVKATAPAEEDNAAQLWTFDRGYLVNKRTAYVLGIKNDRLKDGESVIQVQRRPTTNAMSQRWDITNGTIHLRNKKELVLTSNVENDNVHVHNPVEGGDPSQRWDMIPQGDEIKQS